MGEIFSEYSLKNRADLPPLTVVQGLGTILRSDGNRNLLYDKSNLSNYKLVHKDDFIVHLRSFEAGFEKANSDGIVSPAYHVFHGKDTDTRFYYPFFRSKRFIEQILTPHVYGIRDGRSIDIESMKSSYIPATSLIEQIRIGKFIDSFDSLISLHQRKLDNVKMLKKSLLQKLFPKDGEKTPELRFPGFTDAWEQRKLGEVSEIVTGGTPSKAIKEYWEPHEIPWMSSGEINKRRLYSTDNMISIEGFNNSSAKWIKEKSVLVALAGQGKTRGMVAINYIPLTTNQSLAALEPFSILNYEFLFQSLFLMYDELREISSGDGTRGGLNKELLSNILLFVPSLGEQKCIALLLEQFDSLISLHQRKLDHLKELKKGLLQQMFV